MSATYFIVARHMVSAPPEPPIAEMCSGDDPKSVPPSGMNVAHSGGIPQYSSDWAAPGVSSQREPAVLAVADGTIDVAAIDCRSWMLACRHEPAAARLVTAGWTALRPGLPYVTSCHTALDTRAALTAALISLGCFAVG